MAVSTLVAVLAVDGEALFLHSLLKKEFQQSDGIDLMPSLYCLYLFVVTFNLNTVLEEFKKNTIFVHLHI